MGRAEGCPSDLITEPFLARACPEPAEGKGARGMVERVFQHAASAVRLSQPDMRPTGRTAFGRSNPLARAPSSRLMKNGIYYGSRLVWRVARVQVARYGECRRRGRPQTPT